MRVSGWMMMMKIFEAWGISLHEWRQSWILSFTSAGLTRALIFKLGSFLHTHEKEKFPPWELHDLQDEYSLTQTKKKIWYHESCVILKLDPKWWKKFDTMRVLWFSEWILPCTWVKKKIIKSGTMSVLAGCWLNVFTLTFNALVVFNPFFTHAPKWVHLAFQTFRHSKSLHLDILEEALLDSPPSDTIHTQDLLRTEMQDLCCLGDWAGDIK
jgi:hypothetical protein